MGGGGGRRHVAARGAAAAGPGRAGQRRRKDAAPPRGFAPGFCAGGCPTLLDELKIPPQAAAARRAAGRRGGQPVAPLGILMFRFSHFFRACPGTKPE